MRTPQKQNKPIISFIYLETQIPHGNPLSITPQKLAWQKELPSPLVVNIPGWLCRAARVPAFPPRAAPRCQLGEGFLSQWVFVSFENTPCLCCSFSAAQSSSPFPRPGARASVRSRRSQVAGVAGHPRASGTDKVSSAANVSRGTAR